MAAYTQLSVTTAAGTTTVQLGNNNSLTIDSPGGGVGTPAAAIRTPHTFAGFLQYGPIDDHYAAGKTYPPGFHRVSGLSYAGGVVTVTEAGTPGVSSDPWTKATPVTVDDASNVVVDGGGVAAYQTIPLKGISAISLTEAS
jgi:hypothetical protein